LLSSCRSFLGVCFFRDPVAGTRERIGSESHIAGTLPVGDFSFYIPHFISTLPLLCKLFCCLCFIHRLHAPIAQSSCPVLVKFVPSQRQDSRFIVDRTEAKMGLMEKIKEIEAEMARTQKNKARRRCRFLPPRPMRLPFRALMAVLVCVSTVVFLLVCRSLIASCFFLFSLQGHELPSRNVEGKAGKASFRTVFGAIGGRGWSRSGGRLRSGSERRRTGGAHRVSQR
jgi:hypothetical protein